MKTTLLEQQEAIAMMQRKINARTHWFIVGASPMGAEMMRCIEEKFYDGEAGVDFEIYMQPIESRQLIAIAMANKCRMSPEQLAKYLKVTHDFRDRDVILTPDVPVSVLEWMTENFYSDSLN